MNKYTILMLCFLFILPLCYSQEECFIGKPCVWYSVITEQPDYLNATYANITLLPENVTLQMDKITKGIFKYNITYNTTGIKAGCTQFYTTVLVGTICDGKEVKEDTMISDILSFALIIFTIFLTIWVLKFVIESLQPEHDILKGLLILMIILLLVFGIFISFFMLNGTFAHSIDNLKSNILLIMTIFVMCIVGYILIYFMKKTQEQNKSKYNTMSDIRGKK